MILTCGKNNGLCVAMLFAFVVAFFCVATGHAKSGVDLPDLERKAKRGDVEAQFEMGTLYYGGVGVKMDRQLAAELYRKAAQGGSTRARVNLGLMYKSGDGVEQDINQAAYWFRQAADESDMARRQLDIISEHPIYGLFLMTDSRRAVGEILLEVMLEDSARAGGECLLCGELDLVLATAKEIRSIYDGNEIAGDMRFLDKKILLRSRIERIRSSLGNRPVLSLQDGKKFVYTQASFGESPDMVRISKLNKGDEVFLVCRGGGEVGSVPMLKNCQFLDEAIPYFFETIESALTKPYQENVRLTLMQELFIEIKVADTFLREGSECVADAKTCREELRTLFSDNKFLEEVFEPEVVRRKQQVYDSPPFPAKSS